MFVLSVYASCISNQSRICPDTAHKNLPLGREGISLLIWKDNQVLIFIQVRVISVVKVLATQNYIKSYFKL